MQEKIKKEIGKSTISVIPREEEGEFLVKARRVRIAYPLDTKKTLEDAIKKLEELAADAHKRATSKYLPMEVRQKWARVEAYVYQVINARVRAHNNPLHNGPCKRIPSKTSRTGINPKTYQKVKQSKNILIDDP